MKSSCLVRSKTKVEPPAIYIGFPESMFNLLWRDKKRRKFLIEIGDSYAGELERNYRLTKGQVDTLRKRLGIRAKRIEQDIFMRRSFLKKQGKWVEIDKI